MDRLPPAPLPATAIEACLRTFGIRLVSGSLSWIAYRDAVTRLLFDAVACSHVSWWRAKPDEGGLRFVTAGRYARQADAPALRVDALSWPVDGGYLSALRGSRLAVCNDSLVPPRVLGSVATARAEAGVSAFIDVGFSINGRQMGALSCEQASSPHGWLPAEQQALLRIARQVSLHATRRFGLRRGGAASRPRPLPSPAS